MQNKYTKEQIEDILIAVVIYTATLIWSQFLLHRFVLQKTYMGERVLSDSGIAALFLFLQMPGFMAYLWNRKFEAGTMEAAAAAGLPCILLVLPGIWRRHPCMILFAAAVYLVWSFIFWTVTIKRKRVSGSQLWLLAVRVNFRAVFAGMILILLYGICFGRFDQPIGEGNPSQIQISRDDYIGQYAPLLGKLQEDKWRQLPLHERLSVLQMICDIESSYNGIENVTVTAAQLKNTVAGKQNSGTDQIFVNREACMQSDAHQIVEAVLHEWFHRYQDCILEGIDFQADAVQNARFFEVVRMWKYDQENYKDIDTYGYDAYYDQELEKSAREYAETEVRRYFEAGGEPAVMHVNETDGK